MEDQKLMVGSVEVFAGAVDISGGVGWMLCCLFFLGFFGTLPYTTNINNSILFNRGAKWGEDGYYRLVKGQGACGVNVIVTASSV